MSSFIACQNLFPKVTSMKCLLIALVMMIGLGASAVDPVPPLGGNAIAISAAASGGGLSTTNTHAINLSGTLSFTYDMYSAPDQMVVKYNGVQIYSTAGYVQYTGSFSCTYTPITGVSQITVEMTSEDSGTLWEYTMESPPVLTTGKQPDPIPCPDCYPCPCDDEVAGSTSKNLSLVDNARLQHIHDAVDFKTGYSVAGCAPCGADGGSAKTSIPELELLRYHRYQDLDQRGSFGPGVFSNFDSNLQLSSTNGTHFDWIEWFDPQERSIHSFAQENVADATGPYLDKYRVVKSLVLTTATDLPTKLMANAAKATILRWDGTTLVFELFRVGTATSTTRMGRLTGKFNRMGLGLAVGYVHAPSATDAELVYDRTRLWNINQVTDSFGRQATFIYGRSDGQWVVSQISFPGAATVMYTYNVGQLVGLNRVLYPTGDVSRFGIEHDARTQDMKLSIDDAGCSDIHRRKTLYLYSSVVGYSGLPSVPRAPNRIHAVVNGSGEVSYMAWVDSLSAPDANGANFYTYIYEGGGPELTGVLLRFETNNGVPVRTLRAVNWAYSQPSSTYTWEVEQTYTVGAFKKVSTKTEGSGIKRFFERDVATNAITTIKKYLTSADAVAHSQQSMTRNTFNQHLIETDELLQQTKYDYDTKGNLLTKTTAYLTSVSAATNWTYNSRGQVLSETDANLRRTDYVYEEMPTSINYRRLIAIMESADIPGFDNPRATRYFSYDAVGRLATSTDAENRMATYLYDTRNRISRITYQDASYEQWTYGTGVHANLLVTHRDRNGNVKSKAYDATGRVNAETVASPSNVVVQTASMTYRSGKPLPSTVTQDGDAVTYDYDYRMRQSGESRSPNVGVSLTTSRVWSNDGRLHYEQDAYGRRTYAVYNERDLPVRTVSENIAGALGVPTLTAARKTYLNALTRLSGSNPAYVIRDISYDKNGQVVAQTDSRGVVSLMEWDAQGRLHAMVESATDATTIPATIVPYAARTEYGYDAQGNQTAVINPRSFVRNATTGVFTPAATTYMTTSTYTGRNLLKSVTEASGTTDQATVNYTYTLTKQKATQSDPRNATWLTSFTYYPCCNRLYQAIDPLGFATTYTYDANGNVLTTRDANNTGVTKFYDARNRPVVITNTESETTTVTYDDNLVDAVGLSGAYAAAINDLGFAAGSDGSAVEVKNHLGETSLEIRDGVGRVWRRVDGNGNQTTVTYDGSLNGLVTTSVTDALGNTTTSRVDGSGLVREAVDAEGRLSKGTFDANGNQLTMLDPLNVGWTAVYDLRNRRLTTTDTHSDASQATYDLHNNVLTTTDSMAKVTTMAYDFRDRKITLTDRLAAAGVTSYVYDQANHLTKIKDADSAVNGVTDYTYDNRGMLATETFPAGKDGKRTVRTYGYDNGRRLLTRTVTTSPVAVPALNEVTTYGYDFANRLTGRSYNDGKGNDGFTYDDASRLLTAVSGRYGSTVVRAYTGNAPAEKGGRLTSERLDLSGANAGSWTVGYHYDAVNRLDDLSYPSGDHAIRGYTARHQLQSVTFGGTSVATRLYDNSGRLTTTTFGNGLVETRTYRSDANGVDHQLATQVIPGVTNFAYAYDANKRITTETNNQFTAQTQQFVAYDNENRLTSWSRGTDSQTWLLSKVGDWTSTTINGVAQTRSHDAVHEVTAVGVTPINYDLKGNLTQNQDGAAYQWDSENRLANATISDTTVGVNDVATYRYDALGRRVQKTAYGVATTFVHAGAQVVHEFDAKIQLPAASATDDGDGTGTPPGGGILQGAGVTRINYQPSLSPIPSGFFADKGSVYGVRSNGKSYGWQTTARTDTVIRNQHPWPQFDSFNQAWLNNTGSAGTWEVALANGTYAVIVVMGDCASANQTNNVTIEGQAQIDPDPAVATPPAYRRGDFDGYAVTATVADGKLTLSIPGTALNPKVCFIEIGPLGSSITQADRDRLAAAIVSAGDATGAPAFPKAQPSPRLYAYGSYVDEPLLLKAGANRYYYATNRLYSVAAITSQLGQVVERYKYDAYGKQAVLADNGIVAYKPSDYGQFVGFTGRYHDWETGLQYFRARYFDNGLGRFISRNNYLQDVAPSFTADFEDFTNVELLTYGKVHPLGVYIDSFGMYEGAFAAHQTVDPSGQPNEERWAQLGLVLYEAIHGHPLGGKPPVVPPTKKDDTKECKEEHYNGKKPEYTNPGHHQPGHPNWRGGGGMTTVLPDDAEEVYKKAKPESDGKNWYGRNANGEYYRYAEDGHFNAREKSERGLDVPPEIKKKWEKVPLPPRTAPTPTPPRRRK